MKIFAKILAWVYVIGGVLLLLPILSELGDVSSIYSLLIVGAVLAVSALLFVFAYILFLPTPSLLKVGFVLSLVGIGSWIVVFFIVQSLECEGFGCIGAGLYLLFLFPALIGSIVFSLVAFLLRGSLKENAGGFNGQSKIVEEYFATQKEEEKEMSGEVNYCKNCGDKLQQNSQFCSKCGNKVV